MFYLMYITLALDHCIYLQSDMNAIQYIDKFVALIRHVCCQHFFFVAVFETIFATSINYENMKSI